MEIKNLKAFMILAESLNFTKSAEQLFISQSAFSRQIVRLEEELGCQLFVRNKRTVKLTDFGKIFLGHAERIVAAYDKGIEAIGGPISEKGRLRIGILNDLTDDMFPKIINHFLDEHPNVNIIYCDNGMAGLINDLLQDEIDVAYTFYVDNIEIDNISYFKISSQCLKIALSLDHPLADRKSIMLEELADYPFVMKMPDAYNLGLIHINDLCKKAGFTPKIAAVISSVNTMLMLVNSNIGIGFIPNSAECIATEGVKFIPIFPPLPENDFLTVLWKTSNFNPCIKKFIESAKDITSCEYLN